MQSGPIAAFSANAEKNACLRQAFIRRARRTFREVREVPYAEQGTPFGGLPYGEQDPLSQQDAIRRTEHTPPTGFHTPSGKVSTVWASFDRPNVRFMQDRCHARITGCSSFLTFYAGVESIGPLSRDRRPLKRNQLQKAADFLLLKTGGAAEAEFAPRRRPLFVPRRRLLKRKSRLP